MVVSLHTHKVSATLEMGEAVKISAPVSAFHNYPENATLAPMTFSISKTLYPGIGRR